MKIGIIADTHDHHRNVLKAIEIFRKHAVEAVLHAGDIVSADTARLFSQLTGARFIAVFGNCDSNRGITRAAIEGFGGEIHDGIYEGRLHGKSVHMAHFPHAVQQAAESGQYDLIVYGHTHHDDIRQIGKTLIVNPGEATDSRTGFGQVVILDAADLSVAIEPLT
jgi:putative phosphoesterase